jgi:diguanylate cyclase (GGDEF)-like protein/PAS domain S-box-containing protein
MMSSADSALPTALLENKSYFLDAMLDYSRAVIGVKDLDGRYLVVNKEYERLFNLTEADMLGKTDFEVFSAEAAQAFVEADKKVLALGEPIFIEEQAPTVSGDIKYFITVKFPIRDDHSDIIAVGLVATDITLRKQVEDRLQKTQQELQATNEELRQAMEKVELMAVVDQLTGAWNRYKFEQVVAVESGRFHRYKTPLAMVIMDLDGFKTVNDEMGHEAGDYVLKGIVDLYQCSIREVDYLFRWGGDEFILLMPSTAEAMATSVADKLRQTLLESEFAEQYDVSASFSVAVLKEDETVQQWLVRADQGLYKAKGQGKDCVYCCE